MIRIFVGFQVSSIGVQLGKKHSELQTQGKNRHGEPIFLWQFLIIFYIWLTIVPNMKQIWIALNSFSQRNSLSVARVHGDGGTEVGEFVGYLESVITDFDCRG